MSQVSSTGSARPAEPPGRFVVVPLAVGSRRRGHAVDRAEPGNAGLDPDRAVALREMGAHRVQQFGNFAARGVPVRERARAGGAAEQLVQRHAGRLGLDVPQGGVDGGDRRHGHRPAPPVRASVQVLPGVLDTGGVPADQQRCDMVAQIARDGEFTAVESGVPDSGETVVGGDAQGDEVASGAGHEGFGRADLHGAELLWVGCLPRLRAVGARDGDVDTVGRRPSGCDGPPHGQRRHQGAGRRDAVGDARRQTRSPPSPRRPVTAPKPNGPGARRSSSFSCAPDRRTCSPCFPKRPDGPMSAGRTGIARRVR